MANGIEIQTEALAADIRSMTEAVTQAERRTKEMFQLMSELDQMWDGPANRAFQAQFAADHSRMEALCREVRDLISCMEYAREQYDRCEDEVYETIASIQMEGGA